MFKISRYITWNKILWILLGTFILILIVLIITHLIKNRSIMDLPGENDVLLRQSNDYNSPRVAVIIDDLGWNYEIAKTIIDIKTSISVSILPNLRYSKAIAEYAYRHKHDVMLHMPMESHNNSESFTPTRQLDISMTKETIRNMFEQYYNSVPYIIGVNNHMGSKFTENKRSMGMFLEIIKNKRLFFVDSVTTPKSVGFELAKIMGVSTARRTVFIDHHKDKISIADRISELGNMAIKYGAAIGIGHPRSATVNALKDMVISFKKKGINIVSISDFID